MHTACICIVFTQYNPADVLALGITEFAAGRRNIVNVSSIPTIKAYDRESGHPSDAYVSVYPYCSNVNAYEINFVDRVTYGFTR